MTFSRFGLLRGAVAAFVLAALSAPVSAAEKLVVSNWDNFFPPDLFEQFTEATGIEAEWALHATNEEIMGKVLASGGKGYDVIVLTVPFAEALRKLDLVADIDRAQIPNLGNLYPEVTEMAFDPGGVWSVPYAWGTTGLCYRSDLVEGEPTSLSDMLAPAPELEGKITMLSTDRWLLGAGFLSKGYSVNEADPARIDEVKDVLIDAKKTLLAYDDTTFFSKLVSGEAHLVHAWDGWCNYGIAENEDIKYVIPKEGSDLWVDLMVVMKASENKEAAFKFIDFVINAENAGWVVENILYKTPNRAGMESVDPALFEKYPNLAIPPSELLTFELIRDVGDAQKAYAKAVSEIMAAK